MIGLLVVVCTVLIVAIMNQPDQIAATGGTPSASPTPSKRTTSAPTPPKPTGSQLPQPVTAAEDIKLLDALPRRDANDKLALGKVDAPAVMTIWSDFRCPFCSAWERETLPKLQAYVDSGSLRIEHRDMVLFGEDSQRAAVAARAAGAQGRFWEFSSAIAAAAPNSGHPPIDDAAIAKFAKQAGVPDLARFEVDRKDPANQAKVDEDTRYAKQLRLNSTPFFVINRTPIVGAFPTEVFEKVIEANGGKK